MFSVCVFVLQRFFAEGNGKQAGEVVGAGGRDVDHLRDLGELPLEREGAGLLVVLDLPGHGLEILIYY